MMGESQRAAMQAEVARVHESAVFSAQGQFEAVKAWRAPHRTLGVLTAALSTLAAVLTFAADAQIASGILAVVAARGNDYTALRNDSRRLLHVQVPNDE